MLSRFSLLALTSVFALVPAHPASSQTHFAVPVPGHFAPVPALPGPHPYPLSGLEPFRSVSQDPQVNQVQFEQPNQVYRLSGQDQPIFDGAARAIIVNPVPADFSVNVSLNRGGSNPLYRVGEPISISVSTSQDAYVYLFSVQADGRVNLILPNRLSNDSEFLRAGEVRTFPPAGARYRLTISAPLGQAQVLAVATRRRLNLREIAFFRRNQGFADVRVRGSAFQDAVARAIEVEEVKDTQWTTSAVFYRVSN